MDLGKRFKFYRKKAGLRQNKAAELIGVKNYQLGNYETNRSEPSIDVLKRMSKVYGISVDKLIGNSINVSNVPIDESITNDDIVDILNSLVDRINNGKK